MPDSLWYEVYYKLKDKGLLENKTEEEINQLIQEELDKLLQETIELSDILVTGLSDE